jgi:branched-chain amino acid transport system ATP-binding protein
LSGGSPLPEIVDLHVAYGRLEVAHGISLTVEPGAFSVLLGRNGAGKTTTLRAVSGLIRKRAGVVRLGGADFTLASPAAILRDGLVQVLDGHRVFASLTVDDNLQAASSAAVGHAMPRRSIQFTNRSPNWPNGGGSPPRA